MTTSEWIIQFAPNQAEAVAAFRHAAGAQCLVEAEHLWIRGNGEQIDKDARRKLAPDASHFSLAGTHLILEGHRVPSRELPKGNWRPLNSSLNFELPEVASPSWVKDRQSPLKLVRQPYSADVAPNLLLVPLALFADYIELAPEIRLKRWSFVVSGDGECLVRGEPLPPLPGAFFIERAKVATPVGFTWSPPIDAATLRSTAGAAEDELLLWREEGSCQVIDLTDFSRVSRAVVRAARERATHG